MLLYVRQISLFVFGCVLVSSTASIAATLDSSFFNHKYEGDVVPVTDDNGVTTPAYNTGTPDVSGPTTDGNIMSYQNSISDGNGYWEQLSGSIWNGGTNPVSNANGWTVEFRIKLGSDPAGSDGAFRVVARDGDGSEVNYAVFPDSTQYRASGGGFVTVDGNSNTGDFHVFRVAQDPSSTAISLWRDGVPLLLNSTDLLASAGAVYMFWGDGGGAAGGPEIQVDYFRWDSTGAYAPIPEPAGLSLMACGLIGIAVIKRQRRVRLYANLRG